MADTTVDYFRDNRNRTKPIKALAYNVFIYSIF